MEVKIHNEIVYYGGFTFRLVNGKVIDLLEPMRIGDKAKVCKEAVDFCQWTIDNDLVEA